MKVPKSSLENENWMPEGVNPPVAAGAEVFGGGSCPPAGSDAGVEETEGTRPARSEVVLGVDGGATEAKSGVEGGEVGGVLDSLAEALPRRDRCILRVLDRGVPVSELAGALGMTRAALQRRIRRTRRLASDPAVLGMLRAWRRLDGADRRLVYLHYMLRMSLREIARQGLAEGAGGGGAAPGRTLSALRRRMRGIERKARRSGGYADGATSVKRMRKQGTASRSAP